MARVSRRKGVVNYECNINEIKTLKSYTTCFYLRLSEKESKEELSESIKGQELLLRDFIKDKSELELFEIFIDDGKTGTNFNRPSFIKMIDLVKEGVINCIVVKDLSRFGRNYIETGNYLENIFPFLGVRFISVTDNYDSLNSKTEDISFILPIKNIMNENYSRDISKKERSAKSTLRKKGCFLGGTTPYGYEKSKSDKHKLVIDEPAAEIVRQIFTLACEGKGDLLIAKHLNDHDILSPAAYKASKGIDTMVYSQSNLWNKAGVGRILRNEMYIGKMVQGVQTNKTIRGKKFLVPREKWDIVDNTHEPIISQEQFEKVRLIKESRRKKTNKKKKESNENIFKGLVFCGNCGKVLIRKKLHDKVNFKDKYRFVCSTYETTGKCQRLFLKESELIDTTKEVLSRNMMIFLNYNFNNKEKKVELKKNNQITSLENEIKEKKIYKSIIYKNFKEGEFVSKKDYIDLIQSINDEIAVINKKIKLIISETKINSSIKFQNIKELIKKFMNYKQLNSENMSIFINRINVMSNNEIIIDVKFINELPQLGNDVKVKGVEIN